jgi:hypothetical protein
VSSDLPETVLVAPELPIIYGQVGPGDEWYSQPSQGTTRLGLDILGAAFFMLSRYEEVVKPDGDEHDRFPARASLAYQEGFLGRPIVDEYVEILWSVMSRLWPGLKRKTRCYRVLPTHDLDRPFLFPSLKSYAHGLASHVCHGNFPMTRDWLLYGVKRLSGAQYDPFIQGQYSLLDLSETFGLKSCLNVMGARSGKNDFGYKSSDPAIRNLISDTLQRGHEVGFHPGYETLHNEMTFQNEKDRVEKGFGVTLTQGRQHYLRAKFPETWRVWNNAGFAYDSSAGYADMSGFRCGVCRSYPVYDLQEGCELSLRERPLIIMDGTLKASFNEGLNEDEGLRRCLELADICRQFKGEFVILWHNSSLHGEWRRWRRVYRECLRGAVSDK